MATRKNYSEIGRLQHVTDKYLQYAAAELARKNMVPLITSSEPLWKHYCDCCEGGRHESVKKYAEKPLPDIITSDVPLQTQNDKELTSESTLIYPVIFDESSSGLYVAPTMLFPGSADDDTEGIKGNENEVRDYIIKTVLTSLIEQSISICEQRNNQQKLKPPARQRTTRLKLVDLNTNSRYTKQENNDPLLRPNDFNTSREQNALLGQNGFHSRQQMDVASNSLLRQSNLIKLPLHSNFLKEQLYQPSLYQSLPLSDNFNAKPRRLRLPPTVSGKTPRVGNPLARPDVDEKEAVRIWKSERIYRQSINQLAKQF